MITIEEKILNLLKKGITDEELVKKLSDLNFELNYNPLYWESSDGTKAVKLLKDITFSEKMEKILNKNIEFTDEDLKEWLNPFDALVFEWKPESPNPYLNVGLVLLRGSEWLFKIIKTKQDSGRTSKIRCEKIRISIN